MDTRQEPLFFERIEDAIDHLVRVLGGRKAVAQQLWPSKPPRDAHNLIDACLNPERREKFSPHDLLWFLAKGRDAGCHVLMHYIADESCYERPRARTRDGERNDLRETIITAARMLDRATKRLEALEGGE